MSRPAAKLRPATESPTAVDPAPLPEVEPVTEAPGLDDDDENDPFYYGWREQRQTAPDGSEKRGWIPLTYQDLLDPQEGDVVAEDTIHRGVTEEVASILKQRYVDDPSVAVWSDLKIVFEIPGLTSGPGPDICVVVGVEDRERGRRSFRYGVEPGEVRLTVEVVSKNSLKKDYQDLLEIYARLGVEEYVAIRPTGAYPLGPFELRGWRLEAGTERLRPIEPDAEGRLLLPATGVLFGTGADGWGLELWDAATGERLCTPEEKAEERADREAEKRRAAEERHREAMAENERLRARLTEQNGS